MMDKRGFDCNGTDLLQGKDIFSLLKGEVGPSLGKRNVRPINKPHSTSESLSFFFFQLYQVINLWVKIGACISKGPGSEERGDS